MEFRNGVLLQLFECIESTQNEVKRKMIATGACNAVPKSLHASCAKNAGQSLVVCRWSLANPPNDPTTSERQAANDFLFLSAIYNERRFE
jgi:hypothetical protein